MVIQWKKRNKGVEVEKERIQIRPKRRERQKNEEIKENCKLPTPASDGTPYSYHTDDTSKDRFLSDIK
jgi:hypothetical protein